VHDLSTDESTLRHYLHVVARRKWPILLALVLVPATAVYLSTRQQKLYQATAEVLLSSQNLAAALTGTQDPNLSQPADRTAQTQADLARVPAVAARTLRAARVQGRTPGDLLAHSSVAAKPNSNLLDFQVTDPSPVVAKRLTTEYARQFTAFRRELDTASVLRARREVQARLAQLEKSGDHQSPLYVSLVDKDQQLGTLEALQTSNAFLVRRADGAVQIQPRPFRAGILGLALGLILGLGLAFLWEALDTRVRSAEEVAQRLDLPLLARLAAPARRLRKEHRLVMLTEPKAHDAEAIRMLRTNLDFVNLDRQAKTIMVTSAVATEGKSTTAANLAIALARAGRRVVLVDLDLRRPFLDHFFDLAGRPGLTNVVLGHASLEDALARIAIPEPDTNGSKAGGNGSNRVSGFLSVLPSGPVPPNPGEFATSHVLADLLDRLAGEADTVLIDTPPILQVGDAMAVAPQVDGILVICRLSTANRHMLDELRRALTAAPAPKLGFVLTDANVGEGYGYGYGGYASADGSGRSRDRASSEQVSTP